MISPMFGLVFAFAFSNTLAKETYKAAVVEYHPVNSDNAYEDFFTNVRMYLKYIEEAALQGVDIIVFPEDGLTGWMLDDKYIPTFATEIPDSDSGVSPCIDRNGSYSNYLINLSCACKRNKIYSVVNIIEVVHGSDGEKIYHNTNIALNRAGVVIARYRKINLYDEVFYKPGEHVLSTFTTDFGVTFGMFICFDVVFKSPGLDILQNTEVTDIVYSTAWFARLPFYTANSVQHGYAKLHGLNFLAAGLNDPKTGTGGSGIYLADGGILTVYITGKEESKLIIANVPKIKSRVDLSNTCQHAGADSVNSHSSDVHLFFTNTTDLSNYTVQSLDLNDLEVSETVCAKNSEFCCTFNATMKKYSPLPNYSYKLIAYSGVSAISTTKTIGLKQCALVACSEDNIASCGQRNKGFPSGIYFEHISVSGTFNTNDAVYMPSTVTYDLLPTNRYVYCRKVSGNQEEVSMYTTQKLDSLLTFGIFGRTFKYDDHTPGIITDAASRSGHISYMACLLILFCSNCLWII
ncbi:hypothetical protein PPYR_03786 [Photinus pyralis]|uniref:CN hydrolase domain-containing protein n=1 Tax=Photinus pyralis TaxID=7054 RepID=A0A5N4AWI4_PHOPY|nr:vanin-like protein 1 [Photinus pyralis]XP_031333477.1 vanin-like protein 1 [Photinus pyralis]KAB0801596.1 hypothetical protein PPYR_03782 [Photinus pyralis]KAB0801600.1 hypothetical protein PPYR_03786 [Photinus pyralis]